MWNIVVSYQTGNSFGSHDEIDTVGPFDKLETAKENLRRIRIHYDYYCAMKDWGVYRWRPDQGPEPTKPSCFPGDMARCEHSILLVADNGKEYIESPCWCGYFETLYSAEIKRVDEHDDDDMSFTYRRY